MQSAPQPSPGTSSQTTPPVFSPFHSGQEQVCSRGACKQSTSSSVQVWSLPPPAIQRHIQPRDPDIHRGFGGGNAPYTIMEQNGTHRELALGLGHGFGALVTSAAFLGHLLQRFGRTGGQFSAHRHTAVTNGRRCSRCRPPSTSCGRSHLRRAPSSRPYGSRRPRHKLRTKLRCTREVRRRRRRRGRLMIEHKRVIG